MFIGRKWELDRLNNGFQKKGFQFYVVYGRRRVGKTRLLVEFSKAKPAIFFSADQNNDPLNLLKFSRSVTAHFNEQDLIPAFQSWEQAFKYIAHKAAESKLIIVIDELPYLVENNKSLLSTLQHAIDHQFQGTNLMLILCGSSISFMENEVLAHKSPLFGRKTGQLMIQPFHYQEAGLFFPQYTPEEKVLVYGVLGGTPQYLRQFSDSVSIEENIITHLLEPSAALYDEPVNLLRQELRSPAVYNAIIEAIALGANTLHEIAQKTGEESSKVGKYLGILQHIHLIEKVYPAGEDPRKSRKGRYRLKEPLFQFMYKFVYQHRSLVEQGLGQPLFQQKIKPGLAAFLGKSFEEICRQYLVGRNQRQQLPFLVDSFTPWWGSNPATKEQEEIDLVGLSSQEGLYAECKYRNESMDTETYHKLRRRSALLPRKAQHYMLFSKKGFTKELMAEVKNGEGGELISLPQLFENPSE